MNNYLVKSEKSYGDSGKLINHYRVKANSSLEALTVFENIKHHKEEIVVSVKNASI